MVPDDGICASATWNRNGVTVAGGNGQGPALNQLDEPLGLFVDDDGAVYVVDTLNFRVIKWAAWCIQWSSGSRWEWGRKSN